MLLLYALMIIFSVTKQKKGFLLIVLKLAWQDWHRFFHTKKAGQKADINVMSVFVLGIPIGLFIVYNLPLKPYSPFILGALLLGLCVLLKAKKISPSVTMYILAFVVLNIVLFTGREVFAVCGGWREGGGTLIGWINSPGAGRAAAAGLGPSAAAGGSLAESFIPEFEGIDVSDDDVKTQQTEPEDLENDVKPKENPVQTSGGPFIPSLPETFGSPLDNPYTTFDGNNPCR